MRFILGLLLLCCGACSSNTAQNDQQQTTTEVPEQVVKTVAVEVPAIDSIYDVAYLTGKFDPAKHPLFEKVAAQYADGPGYYLHQEAYAAFQKMHEAAAKAGVNLKIISATRNFNRQKRIWEAKWTGGRKVDGMNLAEAMPDPEKRARKILEMSSMPGTSRHHWGTDLDVNALNNAYFEKGKGKVLYEWLTAHAAEYGFCQPYTPKGEERPNGYEEEKWHWSYIPVAQQLTNLAQYQVKDSDISGFKGADVAEKIQVVKNYVLGINPQCLKASTD